MGSLYFSFQGRIGRQTFWLATLPILLITLSPILALDRLGSEKTEFYINLLSLMFIWPSLAIQAKRWHDRDKSAWWILINLVPLVGWIWVLVENGFLRGTIGTNEYGVDPLAKNAA